MSSKRKNINLAQIRQRGAALVVILLSVVLFTTLITGFLVATRIEQMASRNFSYQHIARSMASAAAQHAIAQLNHVSANELIATHPGMLSMANGGALSNVSLSSASMPSAGPTNVFFNAAGVFSTSTNNMYFSAMEVPVQTAISGSNRVTGRFAYWVDDDGTKANINAMAPGSRTVFTATNSRPFGSSVFRSNLRETNATAKFPNTLTNTNAISNMWSYYFSPQQIANFYSTLNGSPSILKSDIFQLTAGPKNLTNIPPWITTNRVNLNTELTGISRGGVRFARNFLTNASGGADLTEEIDNLIENKIDRDSITNMIGRSFSRKYGQDVLRQILVNINDFNLATGTTEAEGKSATTGGGNLNADGIPESYSGLRRFPHLNEISAASFYAYDPLNSWRLQVQTWIIVELVNPYDQPWGDASQIILEIEQNTLSGSTSAGPISQDLQTGIFQINMPAGFNVPAESYMLQALAIEWDFWLPPPITDVNLNSEIKIKSAKLLQWKEEPSTIRDWAYDENDFGPDAWTIPVLDSASDPIPREMGNYFNLTDPNIPEYVSNSFTSLVGIAKNDPRVRSFPGWDINVAAWTSVRGGGNPAITLGSQNSVVRYDVSTGITGISPDRVSPPPTSIFLHPSISNGFTAQNTNEIYRTLTDLGRVHTGLQWRTLHMAAQNPGETAHIPDWALLESFYTTNQVPKLNVNSAQGNATGAPPLATQASDGVLRPTAFRSLLSGGTNTATPLMGFPSASRFTNNPATTISNLAVSVARMNFNPQWSGVRTSRAQFFPQNAYSMVGEVLQVQGLTDDSTISDAANEGRAATFLDAISTTSDVFSIYSVGYAVDRQGRDVGEYRMRTQVAYNPATSRFEAVYSEPILIP
jgi:Tfp pilus assembly protein PilX